MLKESQIVHQSGNYWVLKTKAGYEVRKDVNGYSVGDSAYALSPDGLALAKYRADYLNRKEG